jgi:HD superfamily phosphodiesterase
MENPITKQAEEHVIHLLKSNLNGDYRYHDLAHTLSVRDASLELGRRYRMSDEELEMLELAALFHDTGFTRSYDNHEDASKELLAEFLQAADYPEEKIEHIKQLIEATRVGVEPETLLGRVLKDADFNTFNSSYAAKSEALRHEWRLFRGVKMTDAEWRLNNLDFWSDHKFFTGEGQAMFGEQRRKYLKALKKQIENTGKEKPKKGKVLDGSDFALNSSKAAQMMFKTTLRNQIDLTNIADNKANIMLTINSALITFGIPLLATRFEAHPELMYPAATLLLTCILSIVYATLATRPAKMSGQTDLSKLKTGNTNLFFFGNYFRMDQEEYREGLKEVVKNEDLLDKTIFNDLYFLGLSLGRKYSRLHTTYNIFMIGMVTTVIVYVVSAALTDHPHQ